jgi:hypothetical protein
MIICIAETRKSSEVAVKLLLISLAKYCAGIAVELFYPVADDGFVSWLRGYPQVRLRADPIGGFGSWNVKPYVLLSLLKENNNDVLWIDSDIVVTGDITALFHQIDPCTLVVTEEALFGGYSDPGGLRARLWGFEVGRVFPFAVNSSVLRVTGSHISLLEEWRQYLESEQYKHAQMLGFPERSVHLFGDQDVLTAILTSKNYSNIPVKFLRRGNDILQYFGLSGYTCKERLRTLIYGMPPFLHSQGFKPWIVFQERARPLKFRQWLQHLYLELSPYTLAARAHANELDCASAWMNCQSTAGAILAAIGLWHTPLVGLPIAAGADLIRIAMHVCRMSPWEVVRSNPNFSASVGDH